ncbi:protein vein isoform X2 [Ceratina calcarata]|uniref:Protein vein isoform X2 n=1 Tax=Ceratina calcarata TaxID=156304 RepID=A0AAJ7S4F4_9HYME|nr:protein vein isoform X2 [Ceratina calcarata]XP_026671205.1 protein vein isoform X2 [Ceratina calcarata]
MMWASLFLAGILSGWWGALALAAAPPANRNSLEETSTRTTSDHPPSMSIAATVEKSLDYRLPTWNFVTRNIDRRALDQQQPAHDPSTRDYKLPTDDVRPTPGLEQRPSERQQSQGGRSNSQLFGFENEKTLAETDLSADLYSVRDALQGYTEDVDDSIRDAFISSSRRVEDRPEATNINPKTEESGLIRLPRHSSTQTPFLYPSGSESSVERPRVIRSTKQRPKNRTKADSPREQRRRCRNKGCRGQNWCPDVDVGNRAFMAPTVFEGKARSMSSVRKPGSNYAVTFEVKQVYKSQPGFQPLQKNDSVRLHFRDKSAPGKSTVCSYDNDGKQQQQQRDNQSGVVRANIKRGKVYLVFVNRVGPRNFTILGEPVIRSKKNEQAVQAVVRPDYVREVTLSELRDSIARLRERVKLVCRTRGSPPPRVHWLKDGIPLHPRRGLRIQHKRRRSKVVISSAKPEDSGRYECVAESTSGHHASLAAQLLVAHDRTQETTTAAWPRQEQPCPIAGDFCMNGGTCLFFETVGEPACRCAEGFTGLRCETKDVSSTGNMDKFSSFAEDVTLARF